MDLFTLPAPDALPLPPPPPVWADYVPNTWISRPLPAYVGYGSLQRPESWSYGTAAEVASDFTWGMRRYVWRNLYRRCTQCGTWVATSKGACHYC